MRTITLNPIPLTPQRSILQATVLGLPIGQAVSAPIFGPIATFGAGDRPHSVEIADFNRDGRPDLVVVNAYGKSVSILLGNGDGSFQVMSDYLISPAKPWAHPKKVTTADFNNDGALDVATADQESDTTSLLYGNGDGTFRPAIVYPSSGLRIHGVDIGDLNRDGKLDIATVGWGSNLLAIRLGNGDGTFRPETLYPTGKAQYTVIIADFNREGYNDVATANKNGWNISVLLNNRAGGLVTQALYSLAGGPISIRGADLDRDGDLDLVSANGWANNVSVLLGNGDGTFKAQVKYTTGVWPYFFSIADVNGDAVLGLLTGNINTNYPTLVIPGGDTVSVLLGVGDGAFAPKIDYTVSRAPFGVVTGDLNCDSAPNLVTANYQDANVSVRLNALGSQTPCGQIVTRP